ncbi:unnamed protein product [Rangifer tarandus platyrhynchus]|uniref:Uncharacterized protein n=2 Tax=Rangifer tarandus platyrhynchus TaxID=3082113 RepID=A0ABN8Y666_RANTA|nr:unnamed protein product [Rangifer tarandus platyrhynchus]
MKVVKLKHRAPVASDQWKPRTEAPPTKHLISAQTHTTRKIYCPVNDYPEEKIERPHSGLPGGSDSKASACNAGDLGLIPGLGRSPGKGNGNPLQYSCLENPMDGGAW